MKKEIMVFQAIIHLQMAPVKMKYMHMVLETLIAFLLTWEESTAYLQVMPASRYMKK